MPVLPFHRPYGALVVDGLKDETRGRPWSQAPAWIAGCNAAKVARLQPAAAALPAAKPYVEAARDEATRDLRLGPPGHVLGLAYITASRPIEPTDLPRTFYYEPGRYVWIVARAVRFRRPIPIAELGIARVPQHFAYAPGALLASARRRDLSHAPSAFPENADVQGRCASRVSAP